MNSVEAFQVLSDLILNNKPTKVKVTIEWYDNDCLQDAYILIADCEKPEDVGISNDEVFIHCHTWREFLNLFSDDPDGDCFIKDILYFEPCCS